MPRYDLSCPSCSRAYTDMVLKVAERAGAKCACGTILETAPSQYQTIAVEREWSRGRGGVERTSNAMVFQEAGIPEIKRDCPSMEFKVANGEATPVFRSDRQHRQVMKELSAAKGRYEGQRKREKAAARNRVDKKAVMKGLLKKSGLT